MGHNKKQDGIRSSCSVDARQRNTSPLPCQESAVKNNKMTELIGKLRHLTVGNHISSREHHDKNIGAGKEEAHASTYRELSLLKIRRRIARKESRRFLNKSAQFQNTHLFENEFSNNKLSM